MISLKFGDKVGIVACSNGIEVEKGKIIIDNLTNTLKDMGLIPIYSQKIFLEKGIFNGTPLEKATELNNFYKDSEIKAIFDISGGDMANEVIPYIDYEVVNNNYKPFIGYSDLTVVLNSLYKNTNKVNYLYQIRNILNGNNNIEYFKNTFMSNNNESIYNTLDFTYDWISGDCMKGTVVGGNIRCFSKLAGTPYMIDDFKDKILFLESLSGNQYKMNTLLNQYKQMGIFDKVSGIILGSFTEMESSNYSPSIIELLLNILDKEIPIIKTEQVGHQKDSKCLAIGEYLEIKK